MNQPWDPNNRYPALLDRQEAQDSDEWLLSYADLSTLIIVFLVLMFAFSDFDKNNSTTEGSLSETSTKAPMAVAPQISTPIAGRPIRRQILDQLISMQSQGSYEIDADEDGVTINLADILLFESGNAQLSGEGLERLQRLAPVLKAGRYPITVEGHTDSAPIHNDKYPSNWELSAARASQVVRYLVSQGLAPDRFMAVGYADTRPAELGNSPQARSANRRVHLRLKLPQ